MEEDIQINNQQLSLDRNILESSETIPTGSREEIPEAVPTLPDNAEGNDIVQNLRSLSKRKSKEQFLEKIYVKYGNKFIFDFTNWSGITGNKIKIICPIHGQFEQIPRNLLLTACKTGCKQCGLESKNNSKTKDFKDFIYNAKNIHNNKYVYIEDDYINRKSKIRIICREHGEFIKSAQKHLLGQACFQCKINQLIKDNILVGRYSEELFNNKPELKQKKAYLYYLSINNGKSYKIGISTSLENRMRGIKSKSKGFIRKLDLIWSLEDTLYNCFIKEQEILEKYESERIYFKWSTEIFKSNILSFKLENLD